jgi:hypothetical protein
MAGAHANDAYKRGGDSVQIAGASTVLYWIHGTGITGIEAVILTCSIRFVC